MSKVKGLLNASYLKKYDPEGMHQVYDKWAEIARESYLTNQEQLEMKNIDHFVFVGMGGSGTIGDVFQSILSKTDVHVCVVKGYHLPRTVDSNTLVVLSSVSGDTAETVELLKVADKKNCKIISFSSGGEIEKYSRKNKINYHKIPIFHSPRASLTGYLYHILSTFSTMIPIKRSDILESISKLENLQKTIRSSNLSDQNPSLSLARWMTGIPMIYYPWGLQASAIRFKNSLQENAKRHAMAEDVLEASHNGIVAWEKSSSIKPLLLEGQDDYFKTKERWKILKELFEEKRIEYREVFSVKGNILSKQVCLIYLLDYASIYLAIMNRIDPSPTRSIEFIKSRTKKNT